jgi:hypothetical protein
MSKIDLKNGNNKNESLKKWRKIARDMVVITVINNNKNNNKNKLLFKYR